MKTILCLLAAAVLCGCVSVGRKIDQSKVEQIKKGETTRNQVIQLIGSPDQITSPGDGTTMFQYIFMKATPTGATYIPIVGAFAGGANTQMQMVTVTFDSSNVVSRVSTTYGGNEAGQGASAASSASLPETTENKRPK